METSTLLRHVLAGLVQIIPRWSACQSQGQCLSCDHGQIGQSLLGLCWLARLYWVFRMYVLSSVFLFYFIFLPCLLFPCPPPSPSFSSSSLSLPSFPASVKIPSHRQLRLLSRHHARVKLDKSTAHHSSLKENERVNLIQDWRDSTPARGFQTPDLP